MSNRFKHLLRADRADTVSAADHRPAVPMPPADRKPTPWSDLSDKSDLSDRSAECAVGGLIVAPPVEVMHGAPLVGVTRDTACRMRNAIELHRPAAEFPTEERALRDEKLAFVKAVYDLSRAARIPEMAAAAAVAERRSTDFPRLAEGGKNGASMLHYNNYRNWLTGRPSAPGLGRLADGSPNYANADVLLRNYGGGKRALFGDPAFWESLKSAYLNPNAQKLAKIYRVLELKWRLEYPGLPIPTLAQARFYIKKRWPRRFIDLARRGENYYLQHYRSFVERDPGSIRPNEAWVADSQDCDFMIRVPSGDGRSWTAVRPKICCIMDVKSQHVISVQLVSRNDSGTVAVTNEVIRNAFALGVWRYGRPRVFLTDNGADYTKAGFTTPVIFTPAVSKSVMYRHSIMLELDVLHLTAEPYNARAKYVERFFREMAEYSRAARGYVGNEPETRPATAKVWAKPENVAGLMNEQQACDFLGAFISLYHNKRSADSKYLNGLSPEEAFAPELRYQRPALSFEEYRRAFLLPLAEARVVESRGPGVRVNSRRYVAVAPGREKLWHFDGQPVMVKTDLLDDEHVFLFSLDGKYLCEARTERALPYFVRLTCEADAKLLAEKLQQIRAEKKFLDTWVMEETGGWHKLDPWSLYQLPREAFLGKAKLALLDSMYSVKGETHNPKIHVLPDELHRITLDAETENDRKAGAVCTIDGATHSTEAEPEPPVAAADPEKVRRLARLLKKRATTDF